MFHYQRRSRQIALLAIVLAAAGTRLDGHAILKSSVPAIGGSVTTSDMSVKLTFNVRVENGRVFVHPKPNQAGTKAEPALIER